jgi:hypothetical protein
MCLVHIERTIAIIVEFVPNLLDHRVDDVVDVLVVFLAGGLLLRTLKFLLLFRL